MKALCFTLLMTLFQGKASINMGASHQRNRNLFISVFPTVKFHPVDAFERYVVCVDTTLPGCDDTNVLKFVPSSTFANPQPNEFQYLDTGSATSIQGAFWFQGQALGNSILASFATARGEFFEQGENIDTGTPAYILRPRGDHNWAFSGEQAALLLSSSWVNEQLDVLYKFNRVGGTKEAPTNYNISSEGKLFWRCLRVSFADWFYYIFVQYTMNLNNDPSHPDVQKYRSSVYWQRRSTQLLGLSRPNGIASNYNVVQIVNGAGVPLQPAYDEFIDAVKNEYGNRLYFYGIKPDRIGDYEESCWKWPWSWFQ